MSILSTLRQPQDVARHSFRMLIGGELTRAEGGATFPSWNPATEEPVSDVPDASPSDARAAAEAAAAAQPAWSRRTFQQRREVVLDIAGKLRGLGAQLGLLDTLENGNVLSAMQLDAGYAAARMEYLASVAYEIKGHVTNLDNDLHYTKREPYGVVLRLLPFNHPIASAGVALAAPLLTGNCVILKPSPHTSLSALALAEIAAAVAPPGVVNIVTGADARIASELIAHPAVARISLTGSVPAGQAVMRLAAERLVPLTLELGGKNPLIVFPDADLDHVVSVAVAGMNFKWQGHSCGSTSRILVHAGRKDALLEKLSGRLRQIHVASPLDPKAEMGAISFRDLYERCLSYVESGLSEGAALLCGGDRPSSVDPKRGYFLNPALFGNVDPTMRIAREEIFGPVLSVLAWNDYYEMMEIANGLDYGLTAVVMTNDIKNALRTADALQVGYVEVNGTVSHSPGAPFGGVKMSGFGREGGIEELASYTRTKSINIRSAL